MRSDRTPGPDVTVSPLEADGALELHRGHDLSAFFNPFLAHFAREALRSGGAVRVARQDDHIVGMIVDHDVEKVGSIFTRSSAVAERLLAAPSPGCVFAEHRLREPVERFDVLEVRLEPSAPRHRFGNPVRAAVGADVPALSRLMREVYGSVDGRWLDSSPSDADRCFVVEIDGEIVGAAWATVVGDHGRLHSLSVKPRYRRLRIGSDLWHARVEWARRQGAQRVITEVATGNLGSQAIASEGGMRSIGEIYLMDRR